MIGRRLSRPTYAERVRRALAAGLAAAICVCATGCSGTAAHSGTPAHSGPPPRAVGEPALQAVPSCTTSTAHAPQLSSAGIGMTQAHAEVAPFGVTVTPDSHYVFVSTGAGVLVYRNGTSRLAPAGRVPLPPPSLALGETITRDGRYVLVANSLGGATVLNTQVAESGAVNAVLGTLGPRLSPQPGTAVPGGSVVFPGGAIEVAVTPDARFAFVSLESNAQVAVFNLGAALTDRFSRSDFVGMIPVGIAPVGLAVSPDGRWLYVASELRAGGQSGSGGQPAAKAQGSLSVINVSRAETDPGRSVVATVDAGCQPVRVVVSADGRTVWVTSRASDALLAFSAARLASDPQHAFLTGVRVGEAPVGLVMIKHDTQIVVADSDRFSTAGAVPNLAVVDVADALAHRRALIGYLRSGLFPRDITITPDGRTVVVANFASGQLEWVQLSTVP
jgi:DNA-binding beta-propeller fold protein YncE